MSKDNVKKMFGKIEKDSQLQKKYAELMQAHQKEIEKALAEKIIGLGRISGFEFTKDDLMAARAELIDIANSNKELSDGDMASVSGGGTTAGKIIGTGMMSVMTAGTVCAMLGLISIVYEANIKDSCGPHISLNTNCFKI